MDVPQLIRKMVRSLMMRCPSHHDTLHQVLIRLLDAPMMWAETIMIGTQRRIHHLAIVKTDSEVHLTALIIHQPHTNLCDMGLILDGNVAALALAQQILDITAEVVVGVVVLGGIMLTECAVCTFGIEIGVEIERETVIETEKETEKDNGSGREEAIREYEIIGLLLMSEEEGRDDPLVQNHNHA